MDDKNYADFLDITGASRAFAQDINDFLLSNGCKRDIKEVLVGFENDSGFSCLWE